VFYQSNNEIIFLQSSKNVKKIFQGLTNNKLVNFQYIQSYNSLILLFERGDLFIIPMSFLDSDLFENHWSQILKNQTDLGMMESLIKTSFSSELNFSDLLICSRKKSEPGSILKNDSSSQIFYKNIFTSYLKQYGNNSSKTTQRMLSNTSIIYWVDNTYTSVKNPENIVEFLILNVEHSLLFINLSNLECVNI
jgi:hypothetical protein